MRFRTSPQEIFSGRISKTVQNLEREKKVILQEKRSVTFFMGKEKKISREDIAKMSREEQMKYEIAQELGLLDQVLEEGWKTLSAKETGRIGGIMNRRRKQKEKEGGVSHGKEQ
mgnify:CR=1 FL=1